MDGSLLYSLFVIFFMICYFMVLFNVIIDLFRNDSMGGFMKFIWILLLIFIPLISLLVYVLIYHKGMNERAIKQAQQYQQAQDNYIKSVAGTSPADQIAQAQQLLSSGAISQQEFDALKAKALA